MKNRNTFKTQNIHESTPNGVYNELNDEFHFTFDPCPLHSEFNGLLIPWNGIVYVNPPYGKDIRLWLEYALTQIWSDYCEKVVFLLPANTDTKWFHEVVLPFSSEIRFIKRRLMFGDHNEVAPFASMIVVF